MLRFAKLTCALALGAAGLCAQPISTISVETTGMVGIAAGNTARLNLLNLSPGAAITCTATVTYIDANNDVLKTGTLTILPSQSQSLDLRSGVDLSIVAGDRREIRAQITIQNSCTLVPTLEVFNSVSGQTQVVLGHTVAIPLVPAAN